MTDRYAVVGNPIEHSKSPIIHAAFARALGHDIEYTRILAPLDGFSQTVMAFRSSGGRGVNVTVPFKLEAFALAQARSARAELAQACNCLRFDDIQVFGDNTDGNGIVTDIQNNLGTSLRHKRILVMGAGGAVQGVLGPLLDERPAALMIANRTLDKARQLAAYFSAHPRYATQPVAAVSYAQTRDGHFDVVINGTSASLKDAVPELPAGVFAPGALAYDMMYGKGSTPFLELARAQGVRRAADGLGMLVEQAAESYWVWRGIRPDTAAVIASLRSA